jgi:hypothetical protein
VSRIPEIPAVGRRYADFSDVLHHLSRISDWRRLIRARERPLRERCQTNASAALRRHGRGIEPRRPDIRGKGPFAAMVWMIGNSYIRITGINRVTKNDCPKRRRSQ